jgi:xanthine dehydrogenase large subunit
MQGEPFKYFSFGAAVSEVEVDGFTGAYRFLRTDIVHDVGDSLSPLIDLGQIEGGFVQGAGWLTLEELRWDTSDGEHRGRLATQAASTYKLPSFSEMPEELNVHLYERATESGVVYGSKAVGEPPLMLAFSVREALRAAVAAFGPDGTVVELASPATPEAVFWALDAARSTGVGAGSETGTGSPRSDAGLPSAHDGEAEAATPGAAAPGVAEAERRRPERVVRT